MKKTILDYSKNGKESIENLNGGTKQKQLLSEIKIEKYEMKTNEKNDIIIRLNKLETYIKIKKRLLKGKIRNLNNKKRILKAKKMK